MEKEIAKQKIIEQKIFIIRGHRVILDKDLAMLYGVSTKRLNEQVRRNSRRFPDDFMFQLTREEAETLVSQNVIPSKRNLGGYLPYVFTEQGVAMLSSALNNERAITVNIQIMRTFVKIKEMLTTHKDLQSKIEAMEKNYDRQSRVVFEAIKQLIKEEQKPKKSIGFHE